MALSVNWIAPRGITRILKLLNLQAMISGSLFCLDIAILCATQYNANMSRDDVFSSQILELRRGTIVLAILSLLHTPRYGYGLLQQLEHAEVGIDAGTLYPLLRRLERQKVLESFWDSTESRPRKYYRLTATGEDLYVRLADEWSRMTDGIRTMMQENS